MRSAWALGLACLALGLAACGTAPRDLVRAKVQQFAHATARREVGTLCVQVLAPELVARLSAAGLTCPQAMQLFVASVRNPTLSIARVTVHGQRAAAVVLSAATGQKPSLESIQLIRTSHGWRVASLAGPR